MILFIIVEAATPQLVSVWFAVGALGATLTSLLTKDLAIEFLVFFAVSGIFLLFTRPLAKKVTKVDKSATNADMVIGKLGLVTQDIDPLAGTGRIEVMGGTWAAYTKQGQTIQKGATVKIVKISGVKLLVEPQS